MEHVECREDLGHDFSKGLAILQKGARCAGLFGSYLVAVYYQDIANFAPNL